VRAAMRVKRGGKSRGAGEREGTHGVCVWFVRE
jgi:hypothetical protein